jgi:hypothetical protein
MSLSNWEANGWLTTHTTSRREVADLLGVVERDGNCPGSSSTPVP